jgi:hypothetical protein
MVARFRAMFKPEMVEKAAKLGPDAARSGDRSRRYVEEEAQRADERTRP